MVAKIAGPVVRCCEPVGSSRFDETDAAELAAGFHALADPVRAQRYPLAGPLLDRVRRVVTPV